MDFEQRMGYYYHPDMDPYCQTDIVSVVTRNLSANSQFCGGKVLTKDIDPILGIDSTEQDEKLIKEEPDVFCYDAWKSKPVDEWTAKDVLSWLSSEAENFNVLLHEVQGHNFAGIDGSRLKQMTEDEFCMLSPHFGYSLYDKLQSLVRMNLNKSYQIDQLNPVYPIEDFFIQKFEHETDFSMRNLDEENQCIAKPMNYIVPDFETSSDSGFETELPVVSPVAKRRPGRPKGSRRKKKPEKLGRLWEFIRDLLLNSEYCPSLICWDNYEEGMFRFVHSDKVAKLWGSKKDNPEMNYEKLSRAMRYYYKSRVLLPVFGRRLVYKFGPTATGWRTSNPNFRRRG